MKKKSIKSESIIVRVTPEMKNNFEKIAKLKRRKPSDYLRIIIEDAVKENLKK